MSQESPSLDVVENVDKLGNRYEMIMTVNGDFQERVAMNCRNTVFLPVGIGPVDVACVCFAAVTSLDVELQPGDWPVVIRIWRARTSWSNSFSCGVAFLIAELKVVKLLNSPMR